MADHFCISGSFPLKASATSADVCQASAEAHRAWILDSYDFKIKAGTPAVVEFCFEGMITAAFAEEIVKTVQAWAERFAQWAQGVLEYTVTFDDTRKHCFYGPENRCIESKLAAIGDRINELQEEWNDLNYTQLPASSDECVELVDWEKPA